LEGLLEPIFTEVNIGIYEGYEVTLRVSDTNIDGLWNPRMGFSDDFRPRALAISAVLSVLPSSTTIISILGAHFFCRTMDLMHLSMVLSALYAGMINDTADSRKFLTSYLS
jgi:hypothetical protein